MLNNHKKSPICIKLSCIYEHKVREVVDREVKGRRQTFQKMTWQRGAHFQESSSLQNEENKLLSDLSALLKLILALCMVLYLLKFISPSFLLPKLKSPNKYPPPKKNKRGCYFKCFAKVQPNIRGLTIKKEKKHMIICLFSKVCTYIFLFKYIANI